MNLKGAPKLRRKNELGDIESDDLKALILIASANAKLVSHLSSYIFRGECNSDRNDILWALAEADVIKEKLLESLGCIESDFNWKKESVMERYLNQRLL